MEKIKIDSKELFNKIKNIWDKETKITFFITIISSIIVHFQLYALMITGPDTLINSMYHQADIWEAMLLRFGLDFVQAIKGNIVSPVLASLISILFLGLTVILVIKIFKINNKYFKYIIAILFAVAPNISATLTFFYCSDAYMLGLFLATLSVFLMRKFEKNNWIILISGILLAISMGMYQTYLSVTMVLVIASLIIDILNEKDIKDILKSLLRYLIMGIIGIIVFYVLAHLTLFLKKLSVSSYSGADTIGIKTLLDLPNLLPQAYKSFFDYYFSDEIIPNKIWNTNILYIIIFTITIISIIYITIKNKIYKKKINLLLLLILIIILPICFGIIEIIAPSTDIHILMACSTIFAFPIFFKILEILPKSTFPKICKYIVVICSVVIAWNYTWQDNASYIAIKSMQNQTESTAQRIVSQIEQLEEFEPQMSVLIIGDLENNEYFNKDNTFLETKKIYSRTWGFISDTSTIWRENLDSWGKIFYEYIGVNLKLVSKEECSDILETEEFNNMENYPKKDSIKVINNTVVVKLSD